MAKYADKWKKTFPESIGNEIRPADGVDNTQAYNTDAMPQYMANDPVRFDLQNAINSQLVSNDERLKEKIDKTNVDLSAHDKNPKAHTTGIAGNAASATKLQTARTLALSGKATGSTTFDGTANANINVTAVTADTASKLSTPRTISLGGNATGSANFDGSNNVTINTTVNQAAHANNADVAKTLEVTDGVGAKSDGVFHWVGQSGQPAWLWGANTNPSETYVYDPSNFHVAAANNDGNGANIANTYLKKSGGTITGPLNFANGTWNLVGDDSYMGDHNISGTFCIKGANGETGIALVNVNNESDYARISYNGGNINFNKKIAANLAGNADTATNVAWSGVTGKPNLALKDGDTIYTNDWFRSRGQTGWYNETYCGGWYMTDSTWIRVFNNKSVYTPAKMQADGGFYGNLQGTATNADTVDGYHASDLLRTLGGNRTPVMTDIFDRAGTIDMSTMSAGDKANNKAKINKSRNAIQNLWNTSTGIVAYDGDIGMSNGYAQGTLKLTQSYKNFDKILVVASNDGADIAFCKLWDVYELAYMFSHSYRFPVCHCTGLCWYLFGSVRTEIGRAHV